MTENSLEQSDAENATHACADVRWKPCAHECQKLGNRCIGSSNELEPCKACDGTGLRFPGLTRLCYVAHCSWHGQDPRTCSCDGSGRVPVDGTDAWLDAAEAIGRGVCLNQRAEGYTCGMRVGDRGVVVVPRKSTRVEAIAEAVCKAVGAHV